VPLRAFGRSPGTAHRHIRRLVALGVIAVQTEHGRNGFVRFTFLVRFWRTRPISRRGLARMRAADPDQIELELGPELPPDPAIAAPAPTFDLPRFDPVPRLERDHGPRDGPGLTFGELMHKHGLRGIDR